MPRDTITGTLIEDLTGYAYLVQPDLAGQGRQGIRDLRSEELEAILAELQD